MGLYKTFVSSCLCPACLLTARQRHTHSAVSSRNEDRDKSQSENYLVTFKKKKEKEKEKKKRRYCFLFCLVARVNFGSIYSTNSFLFNFQHNRTIQDPASQRLTWYKPPLTVLVIKKVRDATVLSPFVQLVKWLITVNLFLNSVFLN